MKKLLIDADHFVCKAVYSSDKFNDSVDEIEYSKDLITKWVRECITETSAEDYKLYLSSPFNFRKAIHRNYKSNRVKKDKDDCVVDLYAILRSWMKSRLGAVEIYGLEADDCIGIEATTPNLNYTPIIVSVDKDLMQIPGYYYNPDKKELVLNQEPYSEYKFLTQVLTGDSVDGFCGCPGIGPKKAEQILSPYYSSLDYSQAMKSIIKTYSYEYLDLTFLKRQARLAYILRNGDYNKETKTIKLFNGYGLFGEQELLPLPSTVLECDLK